MSSEPVGDVRSVLPKLEREERLHERQGAEAVGQGLHRFRNEHPHVHSAPGSIHTPQLISPPPVPASSIPYCLLLQSFIKQIYKEPLLTFTLMPHLWKHSSTLRRARCPPEAPRGLPNDHLLERFSPEQRERVNTAVC